MSYNLPYNFNPGDTIWAINNKNIVEKTTCLQTKVKVVESTAGGNQANIEYIVLLTCSPTTYIVKDALAFATMMDAITALETILTGPCPTNSPRLTYTPYYGMPEAPPGEYEHFRESESHDPAR